MWGIFDAIAWVGGFISGIAIIGILIVFIVGMIQESKADKDDEDYYGGDSY